MSVKRHRPGGRSTAAGRGSDARARVSYRATATGLTFFAGSSQAPDVLWSNTTWTRWHHAEGRVAGASAHEERTQPAARIYFEIVDALDDAGVDPADLDPDVMRRAALLAIASQSWEGQLGPLLDTAAARELLGVKSRQGIEQRIKREALIAMQDRDNRWRLPVFQFDADRPIAPLVTAFWTVSPQADPWTAASWCISPHDELEGLTPRAWALERADDYALATVAARDAARLAQ